MPQIIPKDGPVADLLSELTHIPRERIQHWVICVQHDKGLAMIHTLCCEEHAREGLAIIAATRPDIPDADQFTGSN